MGNWKLSRAQEPAALTQSVLRDMRTGAPAGLSRRQLVRRTIGILTGVWLLETLAGTIGFLWPNLTSGFGGVFLLGDLATVSASPAVQGVTLRDGAPAYFFEARAYVQLIDVNLGFQDGSSPDGSGADDERAHSLATLSAPGLQAQFLHDQLLVRVPLPRLPVRPTWHQGQGAGACPAEHGPLRPRVKAGQLTVDTGHITLGPLPVALGQPGARPARAPTGCI